MGSLPSSRPRHCASMATQAAIGGTVVIGVTIPRVASRRVAAPTIVVRTHCDCGPDHSDSNQGSCRRILIPHHLRTLIELHAPPTELFSQVLLKDWILTLQVRATERRLIDRLRIRVKRLARSGACAQGARNEQGAKHPEKNNCQESPR
jgi:hypothetical protein